VASRAKLEVSMWRDTLEARDAAVMTPHFHVVSTDPGWDSLTDDLAAAVATWIGSSSVQVRVRAYDDMGTPPRAPLAEAFRNKGQAGASGTNRDIALCLSFHGGSGRPSERGRLYAPLYILGIGATGPTASASTQTKVGALASILANLGGVNVDWVVWSQKLRTSVPVTNWHVDNAYDTQRRRGMPASARLSGTVDEGDVPNFRLLQLPPPADVVAELEQPA
jgi:hypothetical protein